MRAGLQALAAAFCLLCVGVTYLDVFSIGGAAVIATYAIVIPLRLQSLVISWSFARFVIQAMARVAGFAAAIYGLSIVINFGPPIVDAVAGALLIGVLALGVVLTLRAVRRKALEMVPLLTIASRHGRALLNTQLSLFFQVAPSRMWTG